MPAVKRIPTERRTGKDRRKIFNLYRFFYNGPERRDLKDRRTNTERRDGWVRIGKWSSVEMQGLKIAKYLQQRWSRLEYAAEHLPHILSIPSETRIFINVSAIKYLNRRLPGKKGEWGNFGQLGRRYNRYVVKGLQCYHISRPFYPRTLHCSPRELLLPSLRG